MYRNVQCKAEVETPEDRGHVFPIKPLAWLKDKKTTTHTHTFIEFMHA